MPSSESNNRVHKDIPCELISWDRFYRLGRQLSRTIRNDGFRPEIIVAIARGGYLPARIISDQLDVFDLATVKVEHYHGVHRERIARIRYPLSAEIDNKRVLLVDDVSDSGDTFRVAIQHLKEKGEPAALKTAVLHHKRVSDFVPDYYAEEIIEWRWIIYPWAVIEDLSSFLRDMDSSSPSVDAFAEYLIKHHGIRVDRHTLEDVLVSTLR